MSDTARVAFVMFDLDGTLVDTARLYLDGVPLVVPKHLGRRIAIDEYMDLWGHDVRAWFARAAGERHEQAIDAMYATFEGFYIANHHRCPLYDGVAEGITLLKQRGLRVGVVTTRPQWRAELVRQFSCASAIDFIVGGDRVRRREPFPDSLAFAIERHGGGASMCAYVGDKAVDVEAARASRHDVISVGALWGCRDEVALLASQPDQAFSRFNDCVNWLLN